jgi:hypothetical protein
MSFQAAGVRSVGIGKVFKRLHDELAAEAWRDGFALGRIQVVAKVSISRCLFPNGGRQAAETMLTVS